MKTTLLTIAVCLALGFAGCGDDDSSAESSGSTAATTTSEAPATKTKPKVVVPKGAQPTKMAIDDLEAGSGVEAKAGDQVTVQYVGVKFKNGEEFDSSWSRSEPYSFTLGAGDVIPGWDWGIDGMKVGGRRELTIPAQWAYGESGYPPAIGPNEALVFVIDLLEIG